MMLGGLTQRRLGIWRGLQHVQNGRCRDTSRTDCVDADILASVLDRGGSSEIYDSGLCRIVGAECGIAKEAGNRSGVDDNAAALFPHLRQRKPHAVKDA